MHTERFHTPEEAVPDLALFIMPEHVSLVERTLPCVRVRPEEVAAAGLFDQLPATFAQLAPAGEWIRSQLRAEAT